MKKPPSNTLVIFYAWQSDHPSGANRSLIRDAADEACRRINVDTGLSYKARIDQDTQDVPGLCDIPATILSKIDAANVFLCDLTFVANSETRSCSNPNVLFELGYAFKSLGWQRIVCVMNEKYGPVSQQIFDLDHRRHPISYSYPTAKKSRKETVATLANELEQAFRAIFDFAPPGKSSQGSLDFVFSDLAQRCLVSPFEALHFFSSL